MDVKKIFITLIVIVACVMIGALVLNVLLPNVTTALVDSAEDMIYNATKMSFDFNNNGNNGETTGTEEMGGNGNRESMDVGVTGFN